MYRKFREGCLFFVRATLANAGIISCRRVCLSVRLSVCHKSLFCWLKRLNVGSRKQCHTVAQGL